MNPLLLSINILNTTNINIKHHFEIKHIRIEICLFVFSLVFTYTY